MHTPTKDEIACVLRLAAHAVLELRNRVAVFSCNEVRRAARTLEVDPEACVAAYAGVYFQRRGMRIDDLESATEHGFVPNNHRETALCFAAAVIESGGL